MPAIKVSKLGGCYMTERDVRANCPTPKIRKFSTGLANFTKLSCPYCNKELKYLNDRKSIGFCPDHPIEMRRGKHFIRTFSYASDGALYEIDKQEVR